MKEFKFRAFDKNKVGAFNSYIYQEIEETIYDFFKKLCEYEEEYGCCFQLYELICNDKNGNKVWSNSKVKYNGQILGFEYSVNGWYLSDGILSKFYESEIEVIYD